MAKLELHPDRLFAADPSVRALARRLYETVRDLPIVSPHGHTDPQWFADDAPFPNPRAFLSIPARHDVARRIDCRFLATLASEHRIEEDEAFDLVPKLAYHFAKAAYRL